MKILLVDDDAGSLRGMQIAINMMRHSCDAYRDPVEAVKKYPGQGYDLVITDIYMPAIDGITLAHTIRCANPKARVVFISARSAEIMERATIKAIGEHFFLQKPIDFNLLRQTLDQIAGTNECTDAVTAPGIIRARPGSSRAISEVKA